MDEQNISKIILDIFTKEFKVCDDMSNKEYLEKNLVYLERMEINYRERSENIKNSPTERAYARDLEQNCIGLINGIKFGISFLDSSSIDLVEKK